MELDLIRYSDNGESTLGLLYADKEFIGYILEDTYRPEKIKGKTRIPNGRYEIKYRKEGGHYERYKSRFPGLHVEGRGMLELQNVPNYKFILIHCGNDKDDTEGCLLTGSTANTNTFWQGLVSESTEAYKKIYPLIADKIDKQERVFIDIREIDISNKKKFGIF